jgi:UDP-glucose 6-dehydrogenase
MTAVAIPPDWPVCGAANSDGRVGQTCRAAGDGYGGHCRWHGGLALPHGEWTLLYVQTGIYVVPWSEDEPSDAKAGFRVSWRTAAALVETGQLRRGVFFRKMGQSLLRRLQTSAVTAKVLSRHRCVREYAFNVTAEVTAEAEP